MKGAFTSPLLGFCLAAATVGAQADSNHQRGYGFGQQTAITVDAGKGIRLHVASTYETGLFDQSAAEIVAYDPRSRTLYVTNAATNAVNIISIRNIHQPRLRGSIDLSPYGGGVNSVAAMNGLVAVAVEADAKQEPGQVVFFDRRGRFINAVEVGALPDMLTFTPMATTCLLRTKASPMTIT